MKRVLLLVLAVLCFIVARAQQLKGIHIHVKDSSLAMSLPNASVILSRAKDSMFVASGRTDSLGNIYLKKPGPGAYLLSVFYSGYDDYSRRLLVDSEVDSLQVEVSLLPLVILLQEIIVKNSVFKVRIKGDTVEYNADSFLVDKHANVEELLKNLPGIYIDQKGIIKANGKKVEKVLVGGEEYFSEDPTLVTRSLRSDMVQKVQLYEQKSDQAMFSKINDGKSVQALNLELKPDKQSGYFGRGQLSFGTNGFYDEQLMISRFNGSKKVAGYLLASNIGTTGLNWQDQRTYSDYALTAEEAAGYSKPSMSVLDEWDGTYHNQGIPSVITGGAQYSNKYLSGFAINGSGRYSRLGINSQIATSQQYLLTDKLYSKGQNTQSDNVINSGKGAFKFTIPLSGSNDLIIGLDIGKDVKKISYSSHARLANDKDGLLSGQQRKVNVAGNEERLNGDILWRMKMKNGMSLSLDGKFNGYKDYNEGYLFSNDTLFQQSTVSGYDSTDQFKLDVYHGFAVSQKGVLTIPLSIHDWLGVSLNHSQYNNTRQVQSFQKNTLGDYSELDSVYSNKYSMKGQNILAGVDYGLAKGKLRMDIEFNGGVSYISQTSEERQIKKRSFALLLPSALITYSFSTQHKLVFAYTGQSVIPRVDQLQPVMNNTDPLNQQIGNPDLNAEYLHMANIQYYYFMTERDMSVSGGGVMHLYKNGFTTREWMDNYGKRTYYWTNAGGNYDFSLFCYFNCNPYKNWVGLGINFQLNDSWYAKIVNDQQVSNQSSSFDLTLVPKIYQKESFQFETRLTFSLNRIKNWAPDYRKISVENWILEPTLTVNLGSRMIFKSNWYYTHLPTDQYYGKANVISRLNSSFAFRCLKQQQLELRLSGFDLLRNNTGVVRNNTGNYTTQTLYNTIGNYWLLSLQYYFSKSTKPTKK